MPDRRLTVGTPDGRQLDVLVTGPHALASAALTGGRCRAVVSLAGVAPRGAAGLDWLSGMGPENIEEFAAAEAGPQVLDGLLTGWAAGLAQVTGSEVAESMGGLLSPADQSVMTGEFADYLAASFRAALSTGVAGWRDDDLAFASDWGFGGADLVAVPTAIWQGGQDRMVPLAHGAWLGSQVPGASIHLLPGEGHLTLVTALIGQVLAELVSLAGLPPAGGG